MGRAEDLRDRLFHGKEKAIQAFFDDRAAESMWLDFKQVATGWKNTSLGDDNNNSLSKCVAGFGNTDGGVIIWGVECRANARQGDFASAAKPISNLAAFVALLEGAVSRCSIPAHRGGVHSFAIPEDPTVSDRGFAVTYIPQSQDTPHRDKNGDYKVRSGSDFIKMSHDVLAGMFGRRPQAVPYFEATLRNCLHQPRGGCFLTFEVHLEMKNSGKGIGRDCFVTASDWSHPDAVSLEMDGLGRLFVAYTRTENHFCAFAEDRLRLAPYSGIGAVVMRLGVRPTPADQPFSEDVTTPFSFGCEGIPLHNYLFEIPATVLNQLRDQMDRMDYEDGTKYSNRILTEHLQALNVLARNQ